MLKHGKVQVYHARLMVIGQDRAGKTSLKKSLVSQPFDPEEPSTVGVDVKCKVEVEEVKNWQPLDEDKLGVSKFAPDVAKSLVKELKERSSRSSFASLSSAGRPLDTHQVK